MSSVLPLKKNKKTSNYGLKRQMKSSFPLYVMMLPAIVYLILFNYIPMYGVTLAFKRFSIIKGIQGSPWVGLDHFERFFASSQFSNIVMNTININVLQLLAFPIPIVLALLLNYCVLNKFKKTVQMVTYIPHFISVVVMCSMVSMFLQVDTGVINTLLKLFGVEPVNFLLVGEYFKHIFVLSGIWQTAGWGSIIYIAALAGVDPSFHEAAIIDGASKLQRIKYIDLPSIAPTIIILFIMRIGRLMDLGFQKVFLLQNGGNLASAEVISTYVYKVGLVQSNYSYSTAVNLFNTAINIALLITANKVAKRISETSLF